MVRVDDGTHLEVKFEKSSVITFAEVTFDRMSLNARCCRVLIQSWMSGEKQGTSRVTCMGTRAHRGREGVNSFW